MHIARVIAFLDRELNIAKEYVFFGSLVEYSRGVHNMVKVDVSGPSVWRAGGSNKTQPYFESLVIHSAVSIYQYRG